MTPEELLVAMQGKWQGVCRTWFEPDKLADESNVAGEFSPILGGRFIRHQYSGSLKDKPRNGEETIAFNSVVKQFQVTWVDDFHMNYAIMFSQGPATEHGFEVFGNYDVGADHPPWGWRTEYELKDSQLVITAFNISPEGEEAKAVETVYRRVADGA